MVHFGPNLDLFLRAPEPVEPLLSSALIRAAGALADWHEPAPEPRKRTTVDERMASDATVALFYHELAAYRDRHPEAHDTRTPLRLGRLSR